MQLLSVTTIIKCSYYPVDELTDGLALVTEREGQTLTIDLE